MSAQHLVSKLLLVVGSAILLLGALPLVAAAQCGDSQHPSGKDRCVEEGNSAPQGKAAADPDDNQRGPDRSNGGVDQEGGTGGVNQADQDGNNGCGNDQDFEDDNEGLCGAADAEPDVAGQENGNGNGNGDGDGDGNGDANGDAKGNGNGDGPDEVAAKRGDRPPGPDADPAQSDVSVSAGEAPSVISRGPDAVTPAVAAPAEQPAPPQLPATGVSYILAMVGLASTGLGTALLRAGRRPVTPRPWLR